MNIEHKKSPNLSPWFWFPFSDALFGGTLFYQRWFILGIALDVTNNVPTKRHTVGIATLCGVVGLGTGSITFTVAESHPNTTVY